MKYIIVNDITLSSTKRDSRKDRRKGEVKGKVYYIWGGGQKEHLVRQCPLVLLIRIE
jgi:hypothetical protein